MYNDLEYECKKLAYRVWVGNSFSEVSLQVNNVLNLSRLE